MIDGWSVESNPLLILSVTIGSSSLTPEQAQQQDKTPSEDSTPFLKWYEKQKYNQQGTNPPSVKIMTPSTVKDIFKIIVTLFGIDRNIGDVVTFVNVNNILHNLKSTIH